jgi:hypothetical protein
MSCQYGSRPRAGADPEAGLLWGSDLGIPTGSEIVSATGQSPSNRTAFENDINAYLRSINSPGTLIGGNMISIDVEQLAEQVGQVNAQYNMNPIYANDLIGFCERRPTIDDIPPPLFPIPFFDAEGFRHACLFILQERWWRNCECNPRPPTPACADPILAGRGQCLCQVYSVKSTFYWVDNDHEPHVDRKTFEWVFGDISVRRYDSERDLGYPNILFALAHHGNVYRNSLGEFEGTDGPCVSWMNPIGYFLASAYYLKDTRTYALTGMQNCGEFR